MLAHLCFGHAQVVLCVEQVADVLGKTFWIRNRKPLERIGQEDAPRWFVHRFQHPAHQNRGPPPPNTALDEVASNTFSYHRFAALLEMVESSHPDHRVRITWPVTAFDAPFQLERDGLSAIQAR